jgi:glycosyltransferase involved in cell wall biosynthesis
MNIFYQTEALNYKLKAGLTRYVRELLNELLILDTKDTIYESPYIIKNKKEKIQNLLNNLLERDIYYGEKYDLAHITAMHYEPIEARKYCATIHDLIVFSHPEFFSLINKFLFKKYIYQTLKLENFICVSTTTANQLINKFSISHKKIEVIYEGSSNVFYNEVDYNVLKKFGIDKPYIFFCSTIEPRKNLELLISAFIKGGLNKKYNLVIVGKLGWDYKKLHQIFQRTQGLIYLGYVNDEDLRKLFSLSSVYVNPSFIEGFGLPIIEALKCGAKVICSDIEIFNEVGKNYVQYFDPYNVDDLINKLKQILNSDIYLEIPNKNYFNQYDWKHTALKTLEYYHTIN